MDMARSTTTARRLSWYEALLRIGFLYCGVDVVSDFLSMSRLPDVILL